MAQEQLVDGPGRCDLDGRSTNGLKRCRRTWQIPDDCNLIPDVLTHLAIPARG